MKKFGGTYLMAALALALGGYTYWEFQHAVEGIDPAQGERLAFSFKRDQIDFVELNSKGQTATLEKTGDQWRVTKPMEDLADQSAVESFLFSLAAQRVRTFRGEDEAADVKWVDYGLQPGGASLELGSKGKREKLEVGTKNAYDGSFYVRQKEEVLLGDKGLAQLTDRGPNSLRSRRLWREDNAKIERVRIERPDLKQNFEFTKNGADWSLSPAPKFAVDKQKLEAWVNKVQDFQPTDIVKEGVEAADKTEHLLVIPSEIVRFTFDKKEWALTLGQDKAGDTFVTTSTRPTLYKSSRAQVDPLRITPEYFRDGHAPFNFDVAGVQTVRVVIAKTQREFKKVGADWKLEHPAEGESLVADKLIQLMTRLHALEGAEFAPVGPKKPEARPPSVELLEASGKVVFALSLGEDYKSKVSWNSGRPLRAVRTTLESEVVGVAKADVDRLIDEGLIKKADAKGKAGPSK